MRAQVIAALLLAFVAALDQHAAHANERCDRVVSYFRGVPESAPGTKSEWHIFDPSSRTDVVLLAQRDGLNEVRWDTTFSVAWFRSGSGLYRVDWKLQAKPTLVGSLPQVHELQDWWFNPDSSRWQVGAMRAIGPPQTTSRYWCEVWQASANVASWSLVRADSVECEDGDCGAWLWQDQPFTHQRPVVRLEDLEAETWADMLKLVPLPFDTASVTVGPITDSLADDAWRFVPSSRSPRCGLAFRLLESDRNVVSGPFFFVDLDRRAKTVLLTETVDNMGWFDALAAESCGLWLIPGTSGHPLVIDCGSGRVVFSQPPVTTSGAAWVRPPHR